MKIINSNTIIFLTGIVFCVISYVLTPEQQMTLIKESGQGTNKTGTYVGSYIINNKIVSPEILYPAISSLAIIGFLLITLSIILISSNIIKNTFAKKR